MKDKTKKWLAVAGLLAVCAVLVFGISRVLYHEPDREAQVVERESEETELFVETETPEKTEEEKPSEPPALSEGTATDQPDTPPSYEEEKQEEPAPAENQTPKTGDTKDGMVYVEGFGWITDEGEGSGTYADDMYENGNKIGIMD